MVGQLQPLIQTGKIVNPDGTPTDYFIKWSQQRQIDISGSITAEQCVQIIQAYLADHTLNAGSGIALSPSGNVSDSPTIAAEVQAILDQVSTTQGTILFKGASDWQGLAPGTSGEFLKTNGAGADPSWASGGGGGGSQPFAPWTVPLVSAFTQVNAGGITFSDNLDGINFNIPTGTGLNARGLLQAVPVSTPWNVYCHLDMTFTGMSNNDRIGIAVRNSGSGRISQYGVLTNAASQFAASILHWNSATSYSSDSSTIQFPGPAKWMRLENDGTNLNLYFGDGYNWFNVRSETIASWIVTPTDVGVMVQVTNYGIVKINSFSTTAPIAGGNGPAA